ncbi:MAG: CBS domain-containing protein [Anaerolineae bacterium]|nr:CBS domain-containing protein [Anaerolineae bacterium]
MQYKVRDWMVDVVVYIDPDNTVYDALSLMRRRYTHSVIVNKSDSSPEYGIITSTDISDKIVAQQQNPAGLKCRDIMTSPLILVREDLSLQECAMLMKQHRIHHLPVANENLELVGMISATDFLVAAETMGRI